MSIDQIPENEGIEENDVTNEPQTSEAQGVTTPDATTAGESPTTEPAATEPEQKPEPKPEPEPAPEQSTDDSAREGESEQGEFEHRPVVLDQIADAEKECALAESRVMAAKRALKAAKSDYDDCVAALRDLAAQLYNDLDRPLLNPKKVSTVTVTVAGKSPVSSPGGATTETPTGSQPLAELGNEPWRRAPIESLNLKPKLTERLKESDINTVGQLEALRADIANNRAKWPKGIGEAKITEIENAVIDWLTKNRDSHLFNGNESIPVSPPITSADDSSEAAPEKLALEKSWNDYSDEEQVEFISKRLLEITSLELIEEFRHEWEGGREAAELGDDATDCIYPPGPKQDAWLKGWQSVQDEDESFDEEELYDDSDEEQPTVPVASQPSKRFEYADLDDL